MYDEQNFIYVNYDNEMVYYKEFIKRKQSITRVFVDDLSKIESIDSGIIFESYLKNVITFETLVILDTLENVCNNVHNVLIDDRIRLVKKSRGFVKFDKSKIVKSYVEFLKENLVDG